MPVYEQILLTPVANNLRVMGRQAHIRATAGSVVLQMIKLRAPFSVQLVLAPCLKLSSKEWRKIGDYIPMEMLPVAMATARAILTATALMGRQSIFEIVGVREDRTYIKPSPKTNKTPSFRLRDIWSFQHIRIGNIKIKRSVAAFKNPMSAIDGGSFWHEPN